MVLDESPEAVAHRAELQAAADEAAYQQLMEADKRKRLHNEWLEGFEQAYGQYVPQLGDRLVYCRAGHVKAIEAFKRQPPTDTSCSATNAVRVLPLHVVGIQYCRVQPPTFRNARGHLTYDHRSGTIDPLSNYPEVYCTAHHPAG